MATIDGEFIKVLAKELNDFDLYDAGHSTKSAWKYLLKIAETDTGKTLVSKNRSLKDTLKANSKRRNTVAKQAETEISADYAKFYKSELDMLDTYCYLALTDLLQEMYPDAWSKVEEQQKEELAERQQKRAQWEKDHAEAILKRRKVELEIAKAKKEEIISGKQEDIIKIDAELAEIERKMEQQ